MLDHVVLVDEKDEVLGTMEKLEAHKKGLLHRAFSVMVFNSKGELMLQKRAASKYHSGGLWTNTCCSHPRIGETTQDAATRRLLEEMGISANPTFKYKFIYRAELDQGLVEYEYDHVFTATFDGTPQLNIEEAEDWRFVPIAELSKDIVENPHHYTEWFKIIMRKHNNS